MARDYAKSSKSGSRQTGSRQTGSRKTGSRKTGPARKKPAQRRGSASREAPAGRSGSSWRAYLAGLLSGLFVSFLVYLANMPAAEQPGSSPEPVAAAATPAEPPKPRFDFYTMLPQQTIDGPVEPAAATDPAADSAREVYLLQAGSFRQRNDADRRRAELLLLGLEPRVEEADSDNGRWYRVYLGPFDSHPKMTRARSLTAEQDIDTLLLKRGSP